MLIIEVFVFAVKILANYELPLHAFNEKFPAGEPMS
jgi:hypothetical protein